MKKLGVSVLLAFLMLFAVSGCAKAHTAAAKTVSHSPASSAVSAVSAVSSAVASSAPVSSTPAAAPSSAPQAASSAVSEVQGDTVTLSIDGTNGGGKSYNFSVNLQAGDTVFTVLLRACGKNVYSTGSGKNVFVTALYGMQNSGSNGWVYDINGVRPDYSCGDPRATVKANDKVHWIYSTSAY